MAELTKSDVRHVATLASIKLTKREVEKFRKQLSKVISYVEELKKINTSKVEPTSQATGLENVTRKDEIKVDDCLSIEEALSGTEDIHNNYFIVPRIINEGREE